MIYWEGFGSIRGVFERGERNFVTVARKVGRAPEIPVACLMIVIRRAD